MSALSEIRFNDFVRAAECAGASDLHLASGARPMVRIDGELQPLAGDPLATEDLDGICESILHQTQLHAVRAGNDVSVTNVLDGSHPSLRIHALRTAHGIALAVRLLNGRIPTMEELKLPRVVASLARRQHGLVVFAGPTGCGKSTSMAAVVGEINRTQSRRIITIEDPIEYRHTNDRSLIAQREIGRDAISYESAIGGALRADPDVIVIGEMRERRAIRAALTAAETGHLVLTTLHSASAVQAVDRIVDAVRDDERALVRTQLSACLNAIVCQRLLACVRGGRQPATEVLIANDGIRAMIRDGRTHLIDNAIATGRNSGMQLLQQHVAELIASGEVDARRAQELAAR